MELLIKLLESMTFNEIRDFIDYVQYHHQAEFIDKELRGRFKKRVRSRRSGKPTGGFISPVSMKVANTILTMKTPLQRECLDIVIEFEETDLNTAVAIAQALHRCKSPVRKQSVGSIQVKHIPYDRVRLEHDENGVLVPVLDENGLPIIDRVHGRYLYLKYWQIHGDNDKKKSRVKSIYIGGDADMVQRTDENYRYPFRELAEHWLNTLAKYGVERKRTYTDKETGEKRTSTYYQRRKGDNPITQLENQILACIDMETEPPEIDKQALLELQNDVTMG